MSDALLEAIVAGDVDRLAAHLATGVDPNIHFQSRYGTTPLQTAVVGLEADNENEPGGPIDAVVLLLRHGADVNGWDEPHRFTPIFTAVQINHIEAVRLLLGAGADPNLCDNEGRSPLRVCMEKRSLEMARLLLLCGANKTIHEAGGGGSGMNALGMAVYGLDVEMVKLLLAHGADPHVEDSDGMTVFDHLRSVERRTDLPEDSASQDRLREIRQMLGESPA